MTKIFVPIFFFGKYLSPLGVLMEGVKSAGVRREEIGVLDLEIADTGLGVRGTDAGGV